VLSKLKSKFPVDQILHEIFVEEEFILIKINFKNKLFKMFCDTFKICLTSLPNLLADATVKIEMKNSFDDLMQYLGQDTIKTFLNGSKFSVNVSSNILNIFRECYLGKKKENINQITQLLITIITFLDINADFGLKMEECENSLIWSQLPEFNLLSEQNTTIRELVKSVNTLSDSFPIIKNILNFIEGCKGKFDLSVNSPIGLIRLRWESSGFVEIWEMIKMIHF
jgi:hypothetical protein